MIQRFTCPKCGKNIVRENDKFVEGCNHFDLKEMNSLLRDLKKTIIEEEKEDN